MKQFFEFIPLLAFGITYYLKDFFAATAALMIATTLQVGISCFISKKIEKMPLFLLISVLFFGGLTLVFHDESFVIWKVSIVNWIFAAILLIYPIIKKEALLQKMLPNDEIKLATHNWLFLNNSWGLFFLFVGILNLIVFHLTNMSIWVNFKVFGIMGITILFMLVSFIYIMKNMQQETDSTHNVTEE